MYLTLNQVKLYASLIFAATPKQTNVPATTPKTGMSKYINHERLKAYIFTLIDKYVKENGATCA
jgi:hypothetical protein